MHHNLSDIDLTKITPQELGELLIEAKKAYYTSAKPIMDDATYDVLEEHLKKIHPHHRLFQKVGTPNFDTGFSKLAHQFPMSSQNKVKSQVELEKYFNRHKTDILEFLVQPKLDGLSVELIYKNGQFQQGITRGDGQIGDDISQNIIQMQNFVPHIPDFSGSLRAEIIVTYADFAKLNATVGAHHDAPLQKYTNTRKAAAGISQRLDGLYCNYCSLICWDLSPSTVGANHDSPSKLDTELAKISFLQKNKIVTVDSKPAKNFAQIQEIFDHYSTNLRQSLEFDIDGLVVKINDLKLSDSLGQENHRPLGQVAYKFPARSSQTKIIAITWQVGPLGTITPVAQVEPVELSGAVVTYASLANYQLIQEKDINIGDFVEISRRGDVIPLIEKVVTKVEVGHVLSPENCPSCGSKLITVDKFLKCPNSSCPAKILGCLRLYCKFLDIQNISDKTIEKLYKIGKLKTPADFYALQVADIAPIDGLGEKSATKIIQEIAKKQELTLVELFTAVAIPNFSQKRIQQLVSSGFDTPEKLLDLTNQQLLSQPGFQEGLAQKVVAGLAQRRQTILDLLPKIKLKTSTAKNILNGAIFCITGSLSAPRKDIENKIVDSGGKVANSVSKNTTYLVTNEPNSGSSKLEQATRFGTKIISENELALLLK